ncbi:MAG: acyl-CoA dehydrogenase family protein [Verrucomicrobiales bacterium]|nr:acyl-CoA dehydrogenase family protein [Verrucomicrobiales bacterium]
MDFSWSQQQLDRRQRFAEFATNNLNGDTVSRDRQGKFCRKLWKKCADFGVLSLGMPGGYSQHEEVDFLSSILAMEGLGYGCRDNGLIFGLCAQAWTVQLPIARFGTDAQKNNLLPALCNGKQIGAHALTEPATGSDVYSLGTTATPCAGGYSITGHKRLITFGPIADVFLLFATVAPEKGKWGVTAFLVEKDRPGVSVQPVQEKMGLRTVPIGEIKFENCIIPESSRLGAEGNGFAISSSSLEYERCSIHAGQLGAMEKQLETAVSFAKKRMQFGRPIGSFQSVSNRIANMKLRLETARLLLYRTAWLKEMDKPAMQEAALLKLHLSESFLESSQDAIRIRGGDGYLTEFEIERDLRDSIGGVLYAGTSDIQRNIISKLSGVG